ncbi:hypothetical protein FQN54_004359 [Arachnomyces sp. PD_36]|nr:hypothetical protein FQN54_004359 [Arachnomyces sp. PD_36]
MSLDVPTPGYVAPPSTRVANEPNSEAELWKLMTCHSEKVFYIHEEILKDCSGVLKAVCDNPWIESKERLYTFDEAVTEEILRAFVDHAYHHKYDTNTNPPKGALDTDALFFHLEVYVFADTYKVASLGDYSSNLIKVFLRQMGPPTTIEKADVVFDLIDCAHENLQKDDELLWFFVKYAEYGRQYLQCFPERLRESVPLNYLSEQEIDSRAGPKLCKSLDPQGPDLFMLAVDPFENAKQCGINFLTPM